MHSSSSIIYLQQQARRFLLTNLFRHRKFFATSLTSTQFPKNLCQISNSNVKQSKKLISLHNTRQTVSTITIKQFINFKENNDFVLGVIVKFLGIFLMNKFVPERPKNSSENILPFIGQILG